jgi:DNA invertase Pin-like site-specific DNA recombinase
MTKKPTLKGRPAYSYMRFSAPEQARGDSIRRQTAGTQRFCAEESLILDETLCDRGVSGFHGKNRTEGALGGFLRAFNTGLVPRDAVLIIESLDRLSREKTRLSQAELLQLINGGLTVVTLLDRQVYSADTIDEYPHLLHGALAIAQRAHEESATKARRVGEAWANKRQNLAAGRASRQRFPAWLRWDRDRVVAIPERQELLNWIFTRRAAGVGRRRIVAELNQRGVEPWGIGKRKARGGWQESYITKILSSRAPLGEFQPHQKVEGKRIPVGDPIKGFYPQVVPAELWQAAQTTAEPGTRPVRGRPSAGNLFSGLLFDPLGAPMHVARKGSNCDYLVTALAYRRADRPTFSWRLAHFHEVVLPLIGGLDWSRVFADLKHDEALTRIRAALAEIRRAEKQLELKIERLTDAIMAGDLGAVSDHFRSRSQALTLERNQLQAQANQLKSDLAAVERARRLSVTGSDRIREAMKNLKDEALRERFRRELRTLISKITLYPDGDVPGFPTKEIRQTAAELLIGNRGIVAKLSGQVCGAVRVEFSSGVDLIVWVTYRPGDRVREPASVLAIRGLGYEKAEWLDVARKLGISREVADAA